MRHLLGICLTLSSVALAEPLECDFTDYRRLAGLSAEAIDGDVLFEWDGAAEGRLRATFGLDGGHPVIREMSVLSRAGHWAPLVQEARPVFHVAEGKRRISNQPIEANGRPGKGSDFRCGGSGEMEGLLGCSSQHSWTGRRESGVAS